MRCRAKIEFRSKISAAVRNRKVAVGEMAPEHDPNLPLTKGRGRGPDPLILNSGAGELPPEPPVTSAGLPPEPMLTADPAPEWQQEPLHQDFAPEPDFEDEAVFEDTPEPAPARVRQ